MDNEQQEEKQVLLGHEGTGMGSLSAGFVHLAPVVGAIGSGFPGREATGMGSPFLPAVPIAGRLIEPVEAAPAEAAQHDEHLAPAEDEHHHDEAAPTGEVHRE